MGSSMRCKVGNYKGNRVLRYASSLKNPLDNQMLRMMEQGFPSIFLPFSVVPVALHSSEVHFDVSRCITLSEYVKSASDGAKLRAVFEQFCQLFSTCSALGILLKNVVFNANQVYCDPWANHSLKFLVLPFGGIDPDEAALKSFFATLPKKVRNADPAAKMLLEQYGSYFHYSGAFSPTDFSAFLATFLPNQEAILATQCVDAQPAVAFPYDDIAPATPAISLTTPRNREVACAQPFTEQRGRHARVAPDTGVLDTVDWRTLRDAPSQETPPVNKAPDSGMTVLKDITPAKTDIGDTIVHAKGIGQVTSSGTTVLEEMLQGDAEAVIRQAEQEISPVPQPQKPQLKFSLTRRGTGEKIQLQGDDFSVGKSQFASYQVKNTKTVSRIHARFYCSSDECWISDNDSTNKTFVNERQLVPRVKEKLTDGAVVRMSDEYFTFEECY